MKKIVGVVVVAAVLALPAAALAAKPQLLTVPPQFTNGATQSFEFTIAAAIQYQCSMDGAALAPCTSPTTYSGLAEGSHTFNVVALYNEPEMNCVTFPPPIGEVCTPTGSFIPTWSQASVFDFIVDRTGPTVGFEGRTKQGSASRSRTAEIAFIMERGGSYTCTFDKRTPEPCESPIEWRNVEPGLHRAKVRATDAAGNVGDEFSLEFAVNTRTVTYRSITKTTAKRCVKKKLKKNGKLVRSKSGKVRYKTTCKRVRF